MTFHADESSVDASRPREGFEIVHGTTTYRIASGSRSEVINGSLFTALPSGRSEFGVSFVGNEEELSIRLPVTHPFAQRYISSGVPPKTITVHAWRKQLRSGEASRFWSGLVTSCRIEKHVAIFRVPALAGEALARLVPSVTVGRACPYVLYEAGCNVSRAAFTVATTVSEVAGRVVTVASIGGNPDNWAQFGELVHVPTGERMTIDSQTGTAITMQLAIAELAVGDAVLVFKGCDHTLSMCELDFANKQNFGGSPRLPRGNIFLPNGYGIYQSE